MKKLIYLTFWGIICFGCGKEPEITDQMIDGKIIFDPSINDPEKYLLSYAIPDPSVEQALKPVIIACHGYTATTFEWDEFKNWVGDRDDVYISQVLLGGHGRSYTDFKNSSWKDWQAAITEEYSRLEQAGYKNINLLGASTSSALFIELLASDYFKDRLAPENIMLIDPIVIPSNKTLSLVGVVGPMLGYLETIQSAEEDKVFYHFRPQETLQELQDIINVVRKELEKGISLPENCSLKVYKSEKDPTADPVSAVLIYKGIKTSEGQAIEVEMIESDLHVFTRLGLRETFSSQDLENQQRTFEDLINRVTK